MTIAPAVVKHSRVAVKVEISSPVEPWNKGMVIVLNQF